MDFSVNMQHLAPKSGNSPTFCDICHIYIMSNEKLIKFSSFGFYSEMGMIIEPWVSI